MIQGCRKNLELGEASFRHCQSGLGGGGDGVSNMQEQQIDRTRPSLMCVEGVPCTFGALVKTAVGHSFQAPEDGHCEVVVLQVVFSGLVGFGQQVALFAR